MQPTTLLITLGTVHEADLGQTFDEVVRRIWVADYWGAERRTQHVHVVQLDTAEDRTVEALTILSDRTYTEGETPAHLRNVFGWYGLDCSAGREAA